MQSALVRWPGEILGCTYWKFLNTYDLINVTSYITCILPILQDYCSFHYQTCDWTAGKINDCYCCSVAKSCLTPPNPMDCSKPGFPVLHYSWWFRQLETSDQIDNHCNSVTLDVGRSNKKEPLPEPKQTRQPTQRFLAPVNRASSSYSKLSGLSTKSLPDLGPSILGAMRQSGHKMPPKTWVKIKTKR